MASAADSQVRLAKARPQVGHRDPGMDAREIVQRSCHSPSSRAELGREIGAVAEPARISRAGAAHRARRQVVVGSQHSTPSLLIRAIQAARPISRTAESGRAAGEPCPWPTASPSANSGRPPSLRAARRRRHALHRPPRILRPSHHRADAEAKRSSIVRGEPSPRGCRTLCARNFGRSASCHARIAEMAQEEIVISISPPAGGSPSCHGSIAPRRMAIANPPCGGGPFPRQRGAGRKSSANGRRRRRARWRGGFTSPSRLDALPRQRRASETDPPAGG